MVARQRDGYQTLVHVNHATRTALGGNGFNDVNQIQSIKTPMTPIINNYLSIESWQLFATRHVEDLISILLTSISLYLRPCIGICSR